MVWAVFGLAGDTIELHRGNPFHELLLIGNPLRRFPNNLVPGPRQWFYRGGEANARSSCTLLIQVAESKPEHFIQCKSWFQSAGFKTSYGSTESYIEMRNQEGRKASIKIDGTEVRLMSDE